MRLVLVQPQLAVAEGADNLERIRTVFEGARLALDPEDLVLLPESFERSESRERYEEGVRSLARALRCHVVGGSHRESENGRGFNRGIAAAPNGSVIGCYEKRHPYAEERRSVERGRALGELEIAGRRALVLICADFWFGYLLHEATRAPDLILVPALSVTRKPTPDYSRALWRHLAVARAYEHAAYVGISDWGHPSELPHSFSSGVGGLADPTAVDPERLFCATGARPLVVHRLDFAALEAFRRDRHERGFLAGGQRGAAHGVPGPSAG